MADYTLRVGNDSDAECPSEQCSEWKLVPFMSDKIGSEDPWDYVHESYDGRNELRPANVGLRRKLAVGLAFWLEYYEHGDGLYSIRGTGHQCRWDTTRLAGVLLWEHRPDEIGAKTYEDRAADATRFLDEYNAWANGHVYWYRLEPRDGGGHDLDDGGTYYDGGEMAKAVLADLEPGDRVVIEGEASWLFDHHDLPGVEVLDEFPEDEDTPRPYGPLLPFPEFEEV